MTDGSSPWRQLGNTDAASFRRALARTHDGRGTSPMAPEADAVWDATSRAGLGRLAAAMSWHERKNDSWPPAYGLDSTYRNPWCMKSNLNGSGGWARYATYRDAAIDWVARLTDPKGPYAKTVTLADLIRVYAPASDGNDEALYVKTIAKEVDAMPAVSSPTGPTGPAASANPFVQPLLYDVVKDAARYNISGAEGQRIRNNCFGGRQGMRPLAIVLHIQEGTTPGSLQYWARTPGVQASSSVMVQRDGSLLRVVYDSDGPWTNGDVANPSPKGQRLLNRIGAGVNPNLVTLSVEAEGWHTDAVTDGQRNAICWIVWEWMQRYGLGVADIYRHADINSATRANCPGVYYQSVVDAITAAQSGGTGTTPPAPARRFTTAPDWLTDDMVVDLFPEAAPGGVRTERWLAEAADTGVAPRRVKFWAKGTPGELIEFSNGWFLTTSGLWVGQ